MFHNRPSTMNRFPGLSCTVAIRFSSSSQGCEVRKGTLLYDPQVVQQRLKRESRINRATGGILESGNGLPQRLFAQYLLANPEVLRGGYMKHEVLDRVKPLTVQQRAG